MNTYQVTLIRSFTVSLEAESAQDAEDRAFEFSEESCDRDWSKFVVADVEVIGEG